MIDAQTIWSSKHLPTLPSVAVELVKLSKDPGSEIRDIISLVKTDPAISAKILKVVNSAFFGLSSQVTSLDRAVGLLGTTYVTSIALSFYLSNSASDGGPLAEHYACYWLQSVVQATAAEMLGKRLKVRTESELFLAGLMLDLGRLAMLKAIPQEYAAALDAAREQQCGLVEAEREHLGFDHCEIGAKLIESWQLPEILSDFVSFHHAEINTLPQTGDSQDARQYKILAIAASVGDFFCAPNKAEALMRVEQIGAELLEFKDDGLESFLRDVRVRIDQVSEQFSAQANQLADPTELMAEASAQLVKLAVRENVASMQAIARHQAVEVARRDLETQNQHLQKQTSHDPLTKIFNRKYFDEALAAEVKSCASTARSIGVIFCDIDDFKPINDTYGHQFGDEVLTRFAQAVGSALRPSDVFARYGGDEFVVLVSNPTVKGLEKLSERIHSCFQAEEFSFEGRSVSVTVSSGAALDVPGRDDLNVEARILAAADQEMYRSKNDRGNKSHIRSLVGDFQRRLSLLINQHKFSRRLVARGLLDVAVVSRALLQMTFEHQLIGQLALECGLLNASQIGTVLAEQACTGQRFCEVALNLGLLEEEHVVDLLILQDEPPISLAEAIGRLGLIDPRTLSSVLDEYLKERSCVMQPSRQSFIRHSTPDAQGAGQ